MSRRPANTFYSALLGLLPLLGACSFIDDLTCDSTESNCKTYDKESEDDDSKDKDSDEEENGNNDASQGKDEDDSHGDAEDADEDDETAAIPDGAIDDGPVDDTNWSDDEGASDEFGDGSGAECAPDSVIGPCLDCAAVECGEQLFGCFDSSICYEACTFDCVVQTASVGALDVGLSDCGADQATRVLAKCLAGTQCADKCFQ